MGQITSSGTLSFERSPSSDTAAAAATAILSDASAQSEVYADTAGALISAMHIPISIRIPPNTMQCIAIDSNSGAIPF